MSERRKTIRNYIVSKLKGSRVINTGNIGANRIRPLWTENLPALNVRMEDGDAEDSGTSPREFTHKVSVTIEIADKCKTTEEDLSDKLDDISERVEELIFSDEFLNGLANRIDVSGFGLDIQENGSELQGTLRTTYNVEYKESRPRTRFGQKLDDLETITAKYNMSEDEDVATADDTINF